MPNEDGQVIEVQPIPDSIAIPSLQRRIDDSPLSSSPLFKTDHISPETEEFSQYISLQADIDAAFTEVAARLNAKRAKLRKEQVRLIELRNNDIAKANNECNEWRRKQILAISKEHHLDPKSTAARVAKKKAMYEINRKHKELIRSNYKVIMRYSAIEEQKVKQSKAKLAKRKAEALNTIYY